MDATEVVVDGQYFRTRLQVSGRQCLESVGEHRLQGTAAPRHDRVAVDRAESDRPIGVDAQAGADAPPVSRLLAGQRLDDEPRGRLECSDARECVGQDRRLAARMASAVPNARSQQPAPPPRLDMTPVSGRATANPPPPWLPARTTHARYR